MGSTIDSKTILILLSASIGAFACGDGFLRVEHAPDDEAPEPIQIEFEEPEAESGSAPESSSADANTGIPQCLAPEAFCQGACLDVTTNPQHCGTCGNVCASSECVDGECIGDESQMDESDDGDDAPDAPMCDMELCGTECVDTTTSEAHCGACDNPCAGGQICSMSMCVEMTEVQGVLDETNDARSEGADCGVYGGYAPTTPLSLDAELNEAAQAHADDMATNNFFSHTGSDGSSFVVRIGRTDFTGTPIGENIAAGQQSPAQAVAGWVDSDGHCRNLMNPDAAKIGIGYANGGPYGTLWVQVFGR